jgi:hypothetical protein
MGTMKKAIASALVMLSLVALCIVAVEIANASEASWVTKTAMPTARSNLGLAAVNGKLYAIGGFLGININTTEEYNIATDTWAIKAAMPVANSGFKVTVCQNNIYAIGGGMNNIEVYFPSNDSWIVKEWPTRRYGFGVSTVQDKIYVMGGGRSWLYPEYGYSLYNHTDVYDPATDSWTTASPIPIPVLDCQCVEVDNKIYIISDYLIQIYNPITDSWLPSTMTNLTISGYNSGTTKIESTKSSDGENKIHLVNQTTHQIYYPKSNQWSTAQPMLTLRSIFALTSFNDTLFAIGGLHDDGWAGRENEMYTQKKSEPINTISPTPTLSPTSTPTQQPLSPLPTSTIPEFPTWLIFPLSIMILIMAAIIVRRSQYKQSSSTLSHRLDMPTIYLSVILCREKFIE